MNAPRAPGPVPAPIDTLVTGTLVALGPAPYQFKPEGEPSYYVKIQTQWGLRVIWGAGLERAVQRSKTKPQPGEPVGVRENRTTPLSIAHYKRGAAGELIRTDKPAQGRTHWIVERREYFDERLAAARALRDSRISAREAVKNHPELYASYLLLSRAIDESYKRYRLTENRRQAIAFVREVLARTAEMGDPLPYARPTDRLLILAEWTEHEKNVPVR